MFNPHGLDVKIEVDKLKNMEVGTEEFERQYNFILNKIGDARLSYDNSQLLLMKNISDKSLDLKEKIVEMVIERYESRNKDMFYDDGIRKISNNYS